MSRSVVSVGSGGILSALLIACVLLGTSCRSRPPNDPRGTPLESCLADAYNGSDRQLVDQPPEVIAAAQKCIQQHVVRPQLDPWITHLPQSPSHEELQKGDEVFIQELIACASKHHMSFEVVRAESGSRRMEARHSGTHDVVRSTDPVFLDCAHSGEIAERSFLAEASTHRD